MKKQETQIEKIKKHLMEGKGITQAYAYKRFGCFRLAAQIHRLKNRGMNIKKEMINYDGSCFARYVLG